MTAVYADDSEMSRSEINDFPDAAYAPFTEAELKEGDASPAAAQRILKARHVLMIKSYERTFLAKRNLPIERSPFKKLILKAEQFDYSRTKNLRSINQWALLYKLQTALTLTTAIYDSIDVYLTNSKEITSLKSMVLEIKGPKDESLFSKRKVTEILLILGLNLLLTLGVIYFFK